MPYICLARNDIPDGTLQVLDLLPNTSLRNQSIDPPGQTRYINRAQNDAVVFNPATGRTVGAARGLSAYLLDRVVPGGLTNVTVDITIDGAAAGDTITITGTGGAVVLTAVDGVPDRTVGEFQSVVGTGSNDDTATDLAATINDAVIQAALEAALGIGAPTAAADAAVVTLTSTGLPTLAYQVATLEASAPARTVLSGDRFSKAIESWTTATLAAASAAILARVDAGQALTLADVNTVLSGVVAGTELTTAGESGSHGTIQDLLEILAGREYYLPAGSQILVENYLPVPVKNYLVAVGSFTRAVTVHDSQMLGGEWSSVAVGGDSTSVDRKPIRSTVDSESFQVSLQSGHLAKMQSETNTLFVDNDILKFVPTAYQKSANRTAQVSNARLVTVYRDDGSLA